MMSHITIASIPLSLPSTIRVDGVQESKKGPHLQCTIVNPESRARDATFYISIPHALTTAVLAAADAKCIEFGDPSAD